MAVHSGDGVEKVKDWYCRQSRVALPLEQDQDHWDERHQVSRDSSGLQKGMGESEGWVARMGLWTWHRQFDLYILNHFQEQTSI